MKISTFLYLFIFLFVTVTIEAQKPLWQKGGVMPLEYIPKHQGWFYNEQYIYELDNKNTRLYLYDRKTGFRIEEKILSHAKTNPDTQAIACTPRCHFILLKSNDSLFCYNVQTKKHVFVTKNKENFVYVDEENRCGLLRNGEVYSLETGLLLRKIRPYKSSEDLISDKKLVNYDISTKKITFTDILTGHIINITYSNVNKANFKETKLLLSPDNKTLIHYGNDFIRYIKILDNYETKIALTKSYPEIYYCSFINNTTIVTLSRSMKYYVVQHISTTSGDVVKNYKFFTTYYRSFFGYKNILATHSYKDTTTKFILTGSDAPICLGEGTIYNTYRMFDTKVPDSVTAFPEIFPTVTGSVRFLPGSDSLVYLTLDGNLTVIRSETGEKLREWKLPPYYVTDIDFRAQVPILPHKDGVLIANDSTLYRFSLKNGMFTDSVIADRATISDLRYSDDKKYIFFTTSTNKIVVLSEADLSIKRIIQPKNVITSVAIVWGVLLYAETQSNFLKRYDLVARKFMDSLEVAWYNNTVLNPDASTYYTEDHAIRRFRDKKVLEDYSDYVLKNSSEALILFFPTEVNKLWNIHTIYFGTNTYITTVMEYGDTMKYVREWRNNNSCYTLDAIFSEDRRYCLTISFETIELHRLPEIVSSAYEKIEEGYLSESNTSYWIDGNTLMLKGEGYNETCTLYSLTGENLGQLETTYHDGKTEIFFPNHMTAGLYIVRLSNTHTDSERRIVICKE